ncbi:MAG: nucleotidyl transferase AbiEii/AbiGii toxin family protein [Candidatus Cloacimonetes bacterium]|nr:nucleotidyl transferase AbiEii/AbiGii toxin family protein [Candidatus Cloacimonadota bacterium]
MKKEINNIAASVRARLSRIAKETNRDFIAILLQYFQERFLYRLSISPYKQNFILKGALLFLVYNMPNSRPTRDIDFLGIKTSNTEKNLLQIMNEVISIKVEDGVRFDPESLESEIIKEDTDYRGVSIYCQVYLDRAKIRIHFDIGFGDEIVPEPVSLDFPVLLSDMPKPKLITYTPESRCIGKNWKQLQN